MNEQDVAEVLSRLRAGMDVASVVRHVQDGNLLMQLSLKPEVHRVYEFPYLPAMPSYLFTPNNLYLDSLLYKAAFSDRTHYSDAPSASIRDQRSSTNQESLRQLVHGEDSRSATLGTHYHSAFSMPLKAAHLLEPMIDKLTAKPWTSVISDDQLLRRLIRIYFHIHRPCGPFVQKDLFLEDMVAGRTRFCSPLLVNAILVSAVQSYDEIPDRSKTWLPQSLTYQFLAEARRLWDMELTKKSRITTVQAASLLNYTFANNGLDAVGTIYLEQAVAMSKDMNLFGVYDSHMSSNVRKVRVFTAWSLFTWQALFDLCFFRAPHILQPPQEKLPDPSVDPAWYGEIWLQYPPSEAPIPLYLGHVLRAQMILHIIMNEMANLCFGGPKTRSLTPEEIAILVRRLYDWRDDLPEPLKPRNLLHQPHLTLHVQYLQVLILLMKAVKACSISDPILISELCAGTSPDALLKDANLMLETILRLYYMRHNYDSYDPWITFALIIVGNNAIENLASYSGNNPHIRKGHLSTLILSAQGLHKQCSHYHLAKLVLVQLQSSMQPEHLQLVQTYIVAARVDPHDERLIADHSESQWVIPLIGISDEPAKYVLKNIVKAFEEVELDFSDASGEEGT